MGKISSSARWGLLFLGFCLAILAGRWVISQNWGFTFLLWNLALAVVPWFLVRWVNRPRIKVFQILLLGLTILFLPNTFYMLTDIIHLGRGHGSPFWLDLVILLAYAAAGTLLGLATLSRLEANLVFRRPGTRRIFRGIVYWLIAVGIYVGRFWRWNSWDVFVRPDELWADIWFNLGDQFGEAVAFSLVFGGLIAVAHGAFRRLTWSAVAGAGQP